MPANAFNELKAIRVLPHQNLKNCVSYYTFVYFSPVIVIGLLGDIDSTFTPGLLFLAGMTALLLNHEESAVAKRLVLPFLPAVLSFPCWTFTVPFKTCKLSITTHYLSYLPDQ